MKARLVFGLSLSCLGAMLLPQSEAAAALSATYPTVNSSNPYLLRLRFEYVGIAGLGTSTTPANGWFRLASGAGDPLNGGWLKVTATDQNAPARGEIPAGFAYFPIAIEYASGWNAWRFTRSIPLSVREKMHIEARMIRRPFGDSSGTHSHTVPYPTTLDILENGSATVFPFEPGCDLRWLDQDVTIEIDVWFDSSVVATGFTGRYRYTLAPLRTIAAEHRLSSPYLVPVALVGRPPGNQSWSRLTTTSGAGAGMAITNGQSNAVTTQSSFGFGPINYDSPTETVKRTTEQDIAQKFSLKSSFNVATNNPYGPGTGDVMVCLRYPTVQMYHATRDMDFRLQAGQAWDDVSFAMRELLNPSPTGPVALLTPSENSFLRSLNPLLANPRAVLPEPRYYLLKRHSVQGGAAVGGSLQTEQVWRDEIRTAYQRSTTTVQSQTITIPLGAISAAVGSPLPVPDITSRTTETTTNTVEYRTMHDLETSNEVVVEYRIADSDPTKWIYVEVYYDTIFHSFAFRDASPAPSIMDAVRRTYQIDSQQLKRWQAMHQVREGVVPRFVVGGSLKAQAPEGGAAMIRSLDRKDAVCRAMITPQTGNVLIPDLAAGRYELLVEQSAALQDPKGILKPGSAAIVSKHLLTVGKDGSVTFE